MRHVHHTVDIATRISHSGSNPARNTLHRPIPIYIRFSYKPTISHTALSLSHRLGKGNNTLLHVVKSDGIWNCRCTDRWGWMLRRKVPSLPLYPTRVSEQTCGLNVIMVSLLSIVLLPVIVLAHDTTFPPIIPSRQSTLYRTVP